MKMNNSRLWLALIALAGLGACSAYPSTEADYGNSVEHMVRSQRMPTGPVNPDPLEEGDGQRIDAVLDAYRTDVSRTDSPAPPVQVQFGGGTPQ
jgi:hypothetical protein